jgi:hypothetical protein
MAGAGRDFSQMRVEMTVLGSGEKSRSLPRAGKPHPAESAGIPFEAPFVPQRKRGRRDDTLEVEAGGL